jgi:hypothetical protein
MLPMNGEVVPIRKLEKGLINSYKFQSAGYSHNSILVDGVLNTSRRERI